MMAIIQAICKAYFTCHVLSGRNDLWLQALCNKYIDILFYSLASVCVCVCVCVRAQSLSSVWLFAALWTA